MGYTQLTVQTPSIAGVIPAKASATLTDGNRFLNTGREFIEVTNDGAVSSVVVTIPTPQTTHGLTIQDPQVTIVKDGVVKIIGPFPPEVYNNSPGATDPGNVYIEYDQVDTVKISVFRV